MTPDSQILRKAADRYRRLESETTDDRVAAILRDMAVACERRAFAIAGDFKPEALAPKSWS